jgi:hypothetical protein
MGEGPRGAGVATLCAARARWPGGAEEWEKAAPLPIGAMDGVFNRLAQRAEITSAAFVWG